MLFPKPPFLPKIPPPAPMHFCPAKRRKENKLGSALKNSCSCLHSSPTADRPNPPPLLFWLLGTREETHTPVREGGKCYLCPTYTHIRERRRGEKGGKERAAMLKPLLNVCVPRTMELPNIFEPFCAPNCHKYTDETPC